MGFCVFRGRITLCFIYQWLVSQALSNDSSDDPLSALNIVNSKRYAVGISEIEFGQIAMQMRFANMEVASVNTPLQSRIVSLDCVGVRIAPDIFIHAMRNPLVTSELSANCPVLTRLVGAEMAGPVGVLFDCRP